MKPSEGTLSVLPLMNAVIDVVNANGPKNLDPLSEGRTVRCDLVEDVSPGHIPGHYLEICVQVSRYLSLWLLHHVLSHCTFKIFAVR